MRVGGQYTDSNYLEVAWLFQGHVPRDWKVLNFALEIAFISVCFSNPRANILPVILEKSINQRKGIYKEAHATPLLLTPSSQQI